MVRSFALGQSCTSQSPRKYVATVTALIKKASPRKKLLFQWTHFASKDCTEAGQLFEQSVCHLHHKKNKHTGLHDKSSSMSVREEDSTRSTAHCLGFQGKYSSGMRLRSKKVRRKKKLKKLKHSCSLMKLQHPSQTRSWSARRPAKQLLSCKNFSRSLQQLLPVFREQDELLDICQMQASHHHADQASKLPSMPL